MRRRLNNYFLVILFVCLFSGVFLFMSLLALQDIYNGVEAGYASEWNMVRFSYFVNGILYLAVVVTFFKFRKSLKEMK